MLSQKPGPLTLHVTPLASVPPVGLAPMVVKSMLADDCAYEVTAPASKAARNTRRNRLDTFSMALLLP